MTGDGWMDGGASLQGFWQRAVAVPETGRPAISYDWYREFLVFLLEHDTYVWFAKLVAVGEFMVGLGLLLGMLTGIAAFFGVLMNWNFMLAGTASTNPILGILGLGLMVAWKISGWWGLDRVVMPLVAAPWQRGPLLGGGSGSGPELDPNYSWAHLAEQWARVLIGVGVALYALIDLTGTAQVLVLLGAGVLVAITGLNWLPIISGRR